MKVLYNKTQNAYLYEALDAMAVESFFELGNFEVMPFRDVHGDHCTLTVMMFDMTEEQVWEWFTMANGKYRYKANDEWIVVTLHHILVNDISQYQYS